MSKIKVAVLGHGHLGKWHAQKVAQLEQAQLVAIVEPFEKNKELAKRSFPDVVVASKLEEVIEDIDAAIIVTPTSTHFDLAKTLLEAKKHVFCEKPLCSSFEQAQELAPLIQDSLVQVGHSERCHEAWKIWKESFCEITGKKTIKFNRYAPFKGRATDVDVVQDLMIHDIDLMLYLFDAKPAELKAIGHKIRTDKWDHVTAYFTLDNGDEVIITSGRNHVEEVRSLEVMSSQGCHYVDMFRNKLIYGSNDQGPQGEFVQEQDYDKKDHLLIEHEAFYHSISSQTAPMVSYEDGVKAVFYVSKVLEALESQERVVF